MTCLSQPIKTITIPVPALLRAEQAPHFAAVAAFREHRDCTDPQRNFVSRRVTTWLNTAVLARCSCRSLTK